MVWRGPRFGLEGIRVWFAEGQGLIWRGSGFSLERARVWLGFERVSDLDLDFEFD